MSKKFDELKKKIENADGDQAKNIIDQVKNANKNNDIDENEKKTLMDKAKDKLGGLGNFDL